MLIQSGHLIQSLCPTISCLRGAGDKCTAYRTWRCSKLGRSLSLSYSASFSGAALPTSAVQILGTTRDEEPKSPAALKCRAILCLAIRRLLRRTKFAQRVWLCPRGRWWLSSQGLWACFKSQNWLVLPSPSHVVRMKLDALHVPI